jgi:AcrR family transcriptional regulator
MPLQPPRRPGRPKAADVPEIHADIIAAAKGLFMERGIAATGMEAVAKAAGMTKQTLYARFPGKDALYQAVIEHIIGQWRERQGPVTDNVGTLEEALFQHTVRTVETATREGSALLTRFLRAESGQNPEVVKAIIGPIRKTGIQDIQTILDAFPDTGPAASRGQNAAAAEYYFMLLIGKINDASTLQEPADSAALAAWAQGAVRLFLRGYLAPG